MSEQKKWGDRKDGIWLKDIPAMNRIMPGLRPRVNRFIVGIRMYQCREHQAPGTVSLSRSR